VREGGTVDDEQMPMPVEVSFTAQLFSVAMNKNGEVRVKLVAPYIEVPNVMRLVRDWTKADVTVNMATKKRSAIVSMRVESMQFKKDGQLLVTFAADAKSIGPSVRDVMRMRQKNVAVAVESPVEGGDSVGA
jgi:hypothetical protein